MTLRALRFLVEKSSGISTVSSPSTVELQVDSGSAFAAGLSLQRPVLYVVHDGQVDALLKLGDVVQSVGRKHPAKELATLLFGHRRIPVLRGTYTAPGRLVQGIKAFLLDAVEDGANGAYIVSARDEVFVELWNQANGRGSRHRRTGKLAPGLTAPHFTAQQILDGIPKREVPAGLQHETYVGAAPQIELVRQLIMAACDLAEPVLIVGPTGTGKENVARALHEYGERKLRPFVAVNTAAISRDLFESELFGHVKGAFTGAVADKAGLWEAAGDGTLFLDEIGDLDLDLQSKILRVLDRNEVLRVGGVQPMRVTARVVAATNRNLFAMVQRRQFREDLYYRLRQIMIQTPALAEHPEDIEELAQHVWRGVTKNRAATLPEGIVVRLGAWRWPGNVRELQSVLRLLFFHFGEGPLRVENLDLVFALEGQRPQLAEESSEVDAVRVHRAECLRQLRRADEVMRACQVTLDPVLTKKRCGADALERLHAALHYRLQELQLLCLHPVLFHSVVTFEVINTLRGKLEYLHDLLDRRPTSAQRYYTREVRDQFKVALEATFAEVERVVEG